MRSGHYCFQFIVGQATVHIVRLTANGSLLTFVVVISDVYFNEFIRYRFADS